MENLLLSREQRRRDGNVLLGGELGGGNELISRGLWGVAGNVPLSRWDTTKHRGGVLLNWGSGECTTEWVGYYRAGGVYYW